MAIKKRPIKQTIIVKPKPIRKKVNLFAAKIEELCNRLQDKPVSAHQRIADALGCRVTELLDTILLRTSADIRTHQINFQMGGTHHVHLTWEDESKPRINGHALPRLDAFSTSPKLFDAVIICYLQICKQAGAFV